MKGPFVVDCRTTDPDAAEVIIHLRQFDSDGQKRAVRLVVPADLLNDVPEGGELPVVRITP